VAALIIIVVLLVLMWLLLIRPQRRRQTAQEELLANLQIGDEIVTAGGLYGTIEEVRDSEITLEIAPGTTVRVAKRAVAGIVSEEEDEEEEAAELEAEAEETEPEEEEGEEPELDRSAAQRRG
jgi:preprotein translocase subunit YajC